MSNRGFRLIASAIAASGGGIAMGLGSREAGLFAGFFLIVIGGCLCLTDWIASWREDRQQQPSQNDAPDTRITT